MYHAEKNRALYLHRHFTPQNLADCPSKRIREMCALWTWLEENSLHNIYFARRPKPNSKYCVWRFDGIASKFMDRVVKEHIFDYTRSLGIKWRYTHTKGRLWLRVPMSSFEAGKFGGWVMQKTHWELLEYLR